MAYVCFMYVCIFIFLLLIWYVRVYIDVQCIDVPVLSVYVCSCVPLFATYIDIFPPRPMRRTHLSYIHTYTHPATIFSQRTVDLVGVCRESYNHHLHARIIRHHLSLASCHGGAPPAIRTPLQHISWQTCVLHC